MIFVNNPIQETWIVSVVLGIALIFSLRKRKDKELFPLSITQELKGFAILAIIFAHIGYSLSVDQRFLWPLSTMAGVGVNIFLFLSGYGLTASNLKRKLSIWQFYIRRFKKLITPFWIVLAIYFLLDFFILDRSYSAQYIIKAFLGIFQSADAASDINSPLWYFSIIAFYYVLYPLVFIKKYPWLSAIIIYLISSFLLKYTAIGLSDSSRLYELYTMAFPLGMFAAWLYSQKHKLENIASSALNFGRNKIIKKTIYYIFVLGLILIIGYSAYYPGTGDSPEREQTINVLTMLGIVLLFLLLRVEAKLLYLFGVYSYEIYLLHWPLLSRYDAIFPHTLPWLGVVLYLITFLALGLALNKLPSILMKHTKQLVKKDPQA